MAAIRACKYPLLAALLLTAALTGPASAEDYAAAQGYLHSFNNAISVFTGVFALNKDVNLDTSAYFKYTVDVINSDLCPPSSASGSNSAGCAGNGASNPLAKSVAAVSSASSAVLAGGGAANDTRNELTAGITHNFGNIVGVEAYYDFSQEKDYLSNTPSLTLKKDFFDKNTTLTLGYSRNIDRINGQFMDRAQGRTTDNYYAGITQLLSPTTIAQIGYARTSSRGFESEGIRLVPVDGTPVSQSTCSAKSAACAAEVFPGSRIRNAYIFGANQYFVDGPTPVFRRSSVRLTFRYYTDDWAIKSRMAEVEYYKYLTEQLILRLDYRYYGQSKAFFVKDVYTPSDVFLSASPQLLKFDSNLGGVKLIYSFTEPNIRDKIPSADDIDSILPIRLGSIEGKYEYYQESIGVHANIFMAGLRFLF